jgi:hypothetical protein
MNLSIVSLHQTFRDVALRTGQFIEAGTVSGLGIFEETLTDVNLLEIDRRHSDHIRTYKYKKREEGSKSGADWLWCIGEPGSWISLLIQAKIVNPKTHRCQHLDYKGKQTDYMSKRQSQRTLLVKFAYTHKLLPLYCIYSHLPPKLEPYAKAVKSLSNIEASEWSCSFMSPKYVKKLNNQKKNKQDDLLHYSFPWSYPFFYASSKEGEVTLASSVAQALANLREEFTSLESYAKGKSLSHNKATHHDDLDPRLLLTKDLPKIAKQLLKGSVKPINSPVPLLGIFSSVHVDEILGEYHKTTKPRKRKRTHIFEIQDNVNRALPEPNDSKRFNLIKETAKVFSEK